MNVFGIGLPEMVVIAAIGLLVFGPKRLPELGKTLGRTLKGFQSASQEFEQELRAAVATPADPLKAGTTESELSTLESPEPDLTPSASAVPSPTVPPEPAATTAADLQPTPVTPAPVPAASEAPGG
jgi:sec-independent protein translocase protein TatA